MMNFHIDLEEYLPNAEELKKLSPEALQKCLKTALKAWFKESFDLPYSRKIADDLYQEAHPQLLASMSLKNEKSDD